MNTLVNIAILLLSALVGVGYPMYKEANVGANSTISGLTAKTTLQGDDLFTIVDNAAIPATKKITVTNATTSMKGFNDLTYSPLFSTSAGLASLLSDETGSSGGFVRAGTPTITTPNITTPTLDVTGTDATGDIYYNGGAGVFTRLGIGAGTSYYLRTSAGGIPEWDNNVLSTLVTASTTFLATTTISADSLTNRALVLNSLAYRFPTSRGVAGSVLRDNDGSGTLTWGAGPHYILSGTTQTQATNGTATGTQMLSIPANTVTASSSIRVNINVNHFNAANAVGSCTVLLRKSTGETLFSTASGATIATSDSLIGEVNAVVASNNSVSSQKITGVSTALRIVSISAVIANYGATINTTSSIDFSSAVSLVPVVISNAANVTCGIESYSLELNP